MYKRFTQKSANTKKLYLIYSLSCDIFLMLLKVYYLKKKLQNEIRF